mmetsp:Transcript_9302/g.15999  ORF Transcript_9302/g.15999 Transcript_9302/m.15999 type:complete len:169 (-) Transcript_9302:237-743(-)
MDCFIIAPFISKQRRHSTVKPATSPSVICLITGMSHAKQKLMSRKLLPCTSKQRRLFSVEAHQITISPNGQESTDTFECDSSNTILDGALDAGITSIPHSCLEGTCLTCVANLQSGSVTQLVPKSVFLAQYSTDGDPADQWDEITCSSGEILTCLAYPNSDCTLVVDP